MEDTIDVKKAEEASKKIETQKKIEDSKRNLQSLRDAYRLFGQGDLMKFWLFEEHHCIHKPIRYFPIYEKWLSPYRGKDVVCVEIGVQNGGSAQMWKNYFGKDAKIVGVDINPKCKELEEEQISIEIGSQEDVAFWTKFKEKYPRVDILLDDGGHTMNQQIVTFREMFPHIKDGGLYMCEDCGTSYRKSHVGGGVNNPASFIEFTKKFIDDIHAFGTQGALQPNYNTENIGGIHFYTSIVVVEKKSLLHNSFTLKIGDTTTVHFPDAL